MSFTNTGYNWRTFVHFTRGTVNGCDNQFRLPQGDKVGAEFLLLDSGAQLHACPITHPGQKMPLLYPGIHTASGARSQHDGGRLVTYKLPEGRTIRVLFHACAVQKPILSLGCLAQQGTGVIFVHTLVHCSFLTRFRRNTVKHSCTRKSLFFVKGMMLAPLSKSHKCQWVRRCWKTLRSRCLLVLQHLEILAVPIKS